MSSASEASERVPAPVAKPVESGALPVDLEKYMKTIMSIVETDYRAYLPQVSRLLASFTNLLEEKEAAPVPKESPPVGPNSLYGPNLPNKQYGGICMGVGGIKGILQAGALHEFWVRGQLRNLTYYAGSSAGSIIASLLCVGYEPLDLLTALCAPDFTNQFGALNFMNLPSIYGFYPSSTVRRKIEQMFMLKLGYLPTFADLYAKMHKVLIVPIYCISETELNKRKIYCSHKTTPDMQVSDAVVLSCSIPIIFQKCTHQGKVYIDGAYTSTFPIQALQEMAPEGCDILGVNVKSDGYNLNSFLGYVTSLVMIPLQEQDNMSRLSPSTDVIEIVSDQSISAVNFNLSSTQKMNMFSLGARQIKGLIASLSPPQLAGREGAAAGQKADNGGPAAIADRDKAKKE